MNAREHYTQAERLARIGEDFTGHPSPQHVQAAQLAQVHATLALAASHGANERIERPEVSS